MQRRILTIVSIRAEREQKGLKQSEKSPREVLSIGRAGLGRGLCWDGQSPAQVLTGCAVCGLLSCG